MLRHVGVPALGPASIVALYFTPVLVFGCVRRGLMALAVATISTVAAALTTRMAMRQPSGDPSRALSLISTGILLLPVALLAGPLG